jgi:transposase
VPGWITARDEDGNALGGIRLPHMPRTLADGTSVGAPVCACNGWIYPEPHVDLLQWRASVDVSTILLALSGTFERFSDESLAELYPSREIYEERYRAALDAVLEEGYILQEDHDRYLAQLKGVHIPEIPDLPEARPELDPVRLERMQLPEGGEVRSSSLVRREALGREFEPHANTIRKWVEQADRDGGLREDGLSTTEREELVRLRRELQRVKLEREILAKATAWFAQETARMPSDAANS